MTVRSAHASQRHHRRSASPPCSRSSTAIVVGKDEPLKLALACLLARGHLLIEDIPGVGKSTLAQALATTLGLKYARDPVHERPAARRRARRVDLRRARRRRSASTPGPIFHSVVLADEINRAPPKTQSALLEAMEERQVSLDGQTRKLPDPFFVIATQNPVEQIGAYPLPESQLDRFLMAIELGYPDAAAERELLTGGDRRAQLVDIVPQSPSRRRSPNGSARPRRSTSRPRCSITCRRCSPRRAATCRARRRAPAAKPARGAA